VAAAAGSLVFADGKVAKDKSRETETNVETVTVRSRFPETLIFSNEFTGYERNTYLLCIFQKNDLIIL